MPGNIANRAWDRSLFRIILLARYPEQRPECLADIGQLPDGVPSQLAVNILQTMHTGPDSSLNRRPTSQLWPIRLPVPH